VRQLELEVRELKDLLDEKDEKIDMLSRMHGNRRRPSVSSSSPSPARDLKKDTTPPPKEDSFRVQASPLLLGVENSDSFFMGGSSGRAFIGSFPVSSAALQQTVVTDMVAQRPSNARSKKMANHARISIRRRSYTFKDAIHSPPSHRPRAR
jgi:hypothetical protein